ncbi:stalk domain-containing protein, partial [Peptoniphilus sp. SGI.035]
EAKVDDNNSATPAINDVIEGDKVITGKGEPGADIVVTDDNGNIIGETKVNDDGTWSVIVPDGKEPKAGDVIRATQTEEGKTPTSATTVVKERYTPGEVDEPIIRGRDHKTPTYPVYTVVPGKTGQGSTVIDKLWYIFHIDEYDYQEVRNYKSTDHKMDVTPVIRNDRTMLPLRYVAEAIGADVNWDAKTRTATFTKDGLTAVIQIDSDEIVLSNGKTIKMDAKPLNINDRILVPVTNVANVFGLTNGNTLDGVDQDIEWDGEARTATIYIRR